MDRAWWGKGREMAGVGGEYSKEEFLPDWVLRCRVRPRTIEMVNTRVTLTLPARIHLAWLFEHHFLQDILTLTGESFLPDSTGTVPEALVRGRSLQVPSPQVWPLLQSGRRELRNPALLQTLLPLTHAVSSQAKQKVLPPLK